MKLTLIRSLVVLAFAMLSTMAVAQRDAPQTIASIVMEMNHFPSDEEKEVLKEISENEDNSEAIRTIAEAVHDIEHSPSADHVTELNRITADTQATAAEAQLASVVASFNHMPSDADKQKLSALH